MANPLWYAERLFLNNEIVENLVIPEGIESIGDYAFCLYEGLKSITFPKSLTKIGHGAFFRCGIESVQFFDDLHFVGFHSFQECKNLRLVSFSDGASTIGDCIGEYAFKGCINLNSISLPQSFTAIGQSAFEDCEKLEFVNIPSVQDLGHSCFKGCRRLSTIELPPSLIRIGGACFYDTTLSYIRIPKGVSDIYPFANMNIYIDVEPGNENYISVDGSLYNTKYNQRGKMLVKYFCYNPNVSIKDVRHIESNAFSGCKLLKSIIIDGAVDSIGLTFRGCENLEEIILPNGITSIDGFEGCKKLSNIVIPESVVVIGERAFKDCISLERIVLPSHLIRIEKSAFSGCIKLVEIVMPNSIEVIDDCAFKGCKALTLINISEGVKKIGSEAFCGCTELVDISIPDGVTSIGGLAFENCANLSSIRIPSSVISIGYCIFLWCNNLNEIIIPEGSKTKFEKLLALCKDKLVEQEQMAKKGM